MDVVLELKGITKRFGRLTANDRISLSVQKGSVRKEYVDACDQRALPAG